MVKFIVFEEWQDYDCGGMYIHKFENENDLNKWCLNNGKEVLCKSVIVKNPQILKPKIKEIEIVKSYSFVIETKKEQ